MTKSDALFAAARALRETTARQVFGSPGRSEQSTACVTSAISRIDERVLYATFRAVREVDCPKCEYNGGNLLVHLNDTHRMSFAAIAEYLEGLAVEEMGRGET